MAVLTEPLAKELCPVTQTRPFRVPATIHFGENAAAEVGPEAKRLGAAKALFVTGPVVLREGIVRPVLDSLAEAGVDVEIYDGVASEPTLTFVEEGLHLYRTKKCDCIVAAGGGSPIDAAKAITAMVTNPGKIRDYEGLGKISNPGPPLIAVPTTAGTGSEATIYAVITDSEKNLKMLIGGPTLMPTVAIVDPLLTLKMPRGITAATGFDALTHAIEAYVSAKAQPMTDVMALSAIGLLMEYLPQAWGDPENLTSRSKTMFASMQAGIAISNASVALVHGMSRPLGAFFHLPHGMSNAVLLNVVVDFSIVAAPQRYSEIASAIFGRPMFARRMDGARAAAKKLRELTEQLKVPSLTGLGVTREKLDPVVSQMADAAIASGSPANNPRKATKQEIIDLYYAAL
jgi:alcohol dehydrogenase class IV